MFTINDIPWEIYLVHPRHPMLMRGDGSFSIGACDDSSKSIYINDTLDASLMRKVICHEIAHAAMFSYNVLLTYDQEELLCDLVATYGREIIAITDILFNKLWGA